METEHYLFRFHNFAPHRIVQARPALCSSKSLWHRARQAVRRATNMNVRPGS